MRRSTLMVAGLFLLWSPIVSATTPEEIEVARRLFREAEQAQRDERWSEALEKLERVVSIKETAGVRFHMAACHEELGDLVKALQNFERARKLASDAEADDVLEMVGPALERVRSRVAGVRISVPKGVGPMVVHVDQAVYANHPAGEVLRLNPGTHQVIVVIGGKVRLDRFVSVDEGQTETIEVRLSREPEKAPVPAAKPKENSTEPVTSPPAVPTSAWISFGAGAVLGVAGYLSYAKADSIAEDSAEVCAVSISCDENRAQEVRRWDAAALGLWIGAAVGIGAGVALTIDHTDRNKRHTAVVVSPNTLHLRTTF